MSNMQLPYRYLVVFVIISQSTISSGDSENKKSCLAKTETGGFLEATDKMLSRVRDIGFSARWLLEFLRAHQIEQSQLTPEAPKAGADFLHAASLRPESESEISNIGLRIIMPLEGEIVHTAQHFLSWEVLLPPNSDAQVVLILDGEVRFHEWLNCSQSSCGEQAPISGWFPKSVTSNHEAVIRPLRSALVPQAATAAAAGRRQAIAAAVAAREDAIAPAALGRSNPPSPPSTPPREDGVATTPPPSSLPTIRRRR